MKFQNSVALITGGAMGLGQMFSKKLLEQGTKIVVADINPKAGTKFMEHAKAKYGDDALTFMQCNVTDSQQLKDTFKAAKERFGRLDIVCNNAGIMTTDPRRAKQQVDINLTAVVEGTYHGIELMSRQNGGDGGVVVNVGSAAGIDLMINAAVFSATKHAVVAFTRSFKRLPNFVEDDVRVNCIAPYFCETNMVGAAIKENPEQENVIRKIGMVNIEDIGTGFMRCIAGDDQLNAGVIVVAPNNKIFEMKFGMNKL